jgi:hypothetical protein
MPQQYLFPVDNTSDTLNTWLNSSGGSGSAYLNINEGVAGANDSDYVSYQSGANLSPKITLGRLLVVPSSIEFKYRASGIATINSIRLLDTNDLVIAERTGPISISGAFESNSVELSGVDTATRNYGNVRIQFIFSGVPTGVSISALDMSVSGDYNAITKGMTVFLNCVHKVRYPNQSGDRAYTSGFDSGFGGLPEELFPIYIAGGSTITSNTRLFIYQNNSLKLRPSGDAGGASSWWNSDNTTSNLWSYINDNVDDTLSDSDYIYHSQSGTTNKPEYLYWVSDSGIYRASLSGTAITKICESNSTILNSTHGCYDLINDFIYYGYEIGISKMVGFVEKNGFYENNMASSFGGGLCFDPQDSYIYSLSKEGYFHRTAPSGNAEALTSLAGNFKETPNRRLRIDYKNRNIYAIAQDQTSTLSRLYKYDISSSGWSQLKTLSYGLFGGAFDIDVANSSVYYAASPSDLNSTSFYGIVKEDMYSGAGTRIIEPSGAAFFQCQELIVDTVNDKLYYVGQDNSSSTLKYKTIKTELDGTSPSTILDLPEASGANVLLLDGPIYKSYIDFHLTDFDESLGPETNSYKTIQSAFVSAKVQELTDYSYLTAKILRRNKTEAIWVPSDRALTKASVSDGIKTVRIGKNSGYINSDYNNNEEWDDAVLRLELSSINNNNSGVFKVYSSEVEISVNTNETSSGNIPLYTNGIGVEQNQTSLFTLAGVSVGGCTLYTIASESINSDVDLVTLGFGRESSNTTLFVNGMYREYQNMNMYISGLTPSEIDSDISLYTIGGSPNAVGHTKLYIAVDGSENRPYGKMNLFIDSDGTESAVGRMNMFLHSEPIKVGENTTLYLQNNSSGVDNFATLYIETRDSLPSSGNMPLFIQRDTESLAHNMTMYLQVNSGTNSGVYLYAYSMPKSTNNMTLVIPETLGISSGNRTLYINGF